MTASATGYTLSRFKLLCSVALLASLSACGQIGPLYLPESAPTASESPDSETPKNTAETTPADSDRSAEKPGSKDKPNRL